MQALRRERVFLMARLQQARSAAPENRQACGARWKMNIVARAFSMMRAIPT